MQRNTKIDGATVSIDSDDCLVITSDGLKTSYQDAVYFGKENAPALIAFIQQWLDHDPEQELRLALQNICYGDKYEGVERWDEMIRTVREHDRRHASEQS